MPTGGTTTTTSMGGTTATGGSKATGGTTAVGGTNAAGGTAAAGGSGGAGGISTIPDAAVDTVDAVPPPSRGPAPATAGHNFPFPQNRENSRCIYPKLYRNEDVQASYTQWKNDTVTTDGAKGFRRVKRPNEHGLDANSTVSEGIGYGMLIAVYMDDQTLFDDLWQYEQQFLDGLTGLMNWYIKADGSGPATGGTGPATDADEDMAYALIMADKQWGGKGKLGKNYLDFAKAQMTAIWNNEIFNFIYLRAGPWANDSNLNISYFAPSYYKVFATIDQTPTSNWTKVTDTMYTVLNASLNATNGNTTNGLVPAWCDSAGKPNAGAYGPTGGPSPTNYQYDSCRTPFRVGLDWCLNGDTRAQTYVAKTSGFFNGTVGGATKIVDGYALNGTPQPQFQTGTSALIQSAAFVGPAGVGAMSSATYQTFVNDAYGVLVTGKALVGGTYYDDSWMVMSLLMMTGNFLDYTKI
jgi:Glycosyl hydrolases family 8